MEPSTAQTSTVEGLALPVSAVRQKSVLDHLHEWVVTVDHKKLGLMYIMYALLFLVV